MDLEAVKVANDQQRRVFEVLAEIEQLLVGGGEVLVPPLVFPTEMAAIQTFAQPWPPAVLWTPRSKV